LPERKEPRKIRDGAATREKLIDAAATVFNEVGYHGTDSNRIARAAGYAPGTFYKHFADKREIFLATYERWVATEWESIRGELARPGRGTLTRITRLVLEHHRRWAGFRRSLRALVATDPVVAAFRIRQREAQMGMMRDLLSTPDGGRPNRAHCLAALLQFERVCDAIADGEAEALGVADTAMLRVLKDQLRSLQPALD
jgi:AcrR family transcriptional regulator